MTMKNIIAVFCLFIFLISFTSASLGNVTRALPSQVVKGEEFNVSLIVNPNSSNNAYAIEEYIPNGFEVVNSFRGELNPSGTTLRWLDFVVLEPLTKTTLKYTLKAPDNDGDYSFSGSYSFGSGSFQILGDSSLKVTSAPPHLRFINPPKNITLVFGNSLNVKFEVSASSNQFNYRVNDSRFEINSSGWLKNKVTLVPGNYSLKIFINDSNGLENSTNFKVIVNKRTPVLELLINGEEGDAKVYNGTISNVSCFSDVSGNLLLKRNGWNISKFGKVINETKILPEGYYTYNCSFEGNSNYTPALVSVNLNVTSVDVFSPRITLLYPHNLQVISSGNVNFNFSISEETAVDNCSLKLVSENLIISPSNFFNVGNNVITTNVSTPNHKYRWKIVCYDIFGNKGESGIRTFYTRRVDNSGGDSGSSDSSGNSGGGQTISPSQPAIFFIVGEDYNVGRSVGPLSENSEVQVGLGDEVSSVRIVSVNPTGVSFSINDGDTIFSQYGKTTRVDLDGDGNKETTLLFTSTLGTVNLYVKKSNSEGNIHQGNDSSSDSEEDSEEGSSNWIIYLVIGLIVLVVIVIVVIIIVTNSHKNTSLTKPQTQSPPFNPPSVSPRLPSNSPVFRR